MTDPKASPLPVRDGVLVVSKTGRLRTSKRKANDDAASQSAPRTKRTKEDSTCSGVPVSPTHLKPTEVTPRQRKDIVCALKSCSREISSSRESRVDIQIGLPIGNVEKFFKTSHIRWTSKGEASFHDVCWTEVVRSARARNPKRSPVSMTPEEKSLVKDAAKTAEFHDSVDQVKEVAEKVVQLLRTVKHCTAFTGAGISTSAGIGDYRGKGGKWTEMDRETVTAKVTESLKESGHAQGEEENEEEEEEEEDGVPYEKLRPTYTHEALAKLVDMGLVKYVISQNGDGLHALSGISPEKISELHGNVFVEVCESCGHRYSRSHYVLDDRASLYYEELADHGTTDVAKPRHAMKCQQCGLSHRTGKRCEQTGCKGFLKDSIINFGDDLEEEVLSRAELHSKSADLCLSLGTTMQVTPACNLVEMGRKPLRLVIINRQKTAFDELCFQREVGRDSRDGGKVLGVRVFGDCDSVMREVMRGVMGEEEVEVWEGQRQERMTVYDSNRQI